MASSLNSIFKGYHSSARCIHHPRVSGCECGRCWLRERSASIATQVIGRRAPVVRDGKAAKSRSNAQKASKLTVRKNSDVKPVPTGKIDKGKQKEDSSGVLGRSFSTTGDGGVQPSRRVRRRKKSRNKRAGQGVQWERRHAAAIQRAFSTRHYSRDVLVTNFFLTRKIAKRVKAMRVAPTSRAMPADLFRVEPTRTAQRSAKLEQRCICGKHRRVFPEIWWSPQKWPPGMETPGHWVCRECA